MNPSNFKAYPWSSVFKKAEAEVIAQNIIKILARTGDQWRELPWEEYEAERLKDGKFAGWAEKPYFDKVILYTRSAEDAAEFCAGWADIFNGKSEGA